MTAKTAFVDYRKYPFLVDVRKYVERRWAHGLTLLDVLSMLGSTVMRRAKQRVLDAIEQDVISDPPVDVSVDDELLAYHVSLVIVSAIGDKWLMQSYAVKEAKRVYNHLVGEDDRVVEAIGRFLGLNIHYDPENAARIPYAYSKGTVIYIYLPYRIHFYDYLRHTKRLVGDPSWKLTNQFIKKGYIYLERRRIARIIEEALAQRILEHLIPLEEVPDVIKGLVEELVKKLEEKRGRIVREVIESGGLSQARDMGLRELAEEFAGIVDVELFPPCMKVIYEKALRGEHLSHHERFAIATFLLNIGMDVDSVVNVFRNMPDFNERIARYQVEHLAGLRGSRKKYLPYSCNTMRTMGICVEDCGVKNPLVYYWRQLRKKYKQRKPRRKEEQGKEKGEEDQH